MAELICYDYSMSWIAYSMLMFFSSVAMYLAVRKSSLLKTPTYLTNLAMFAVPMIAYLFIGTLGQHSLSVTFLQAIAIIAVAVFFSYLGNTASLKAIDIAPNPGYSLVISKSYVLFTTIVAFIFLHGELTLRKAIAILLVVGFSALVLINPKDTKKTHDNRWVTLSLAAFFAWGFLILSSKYLFLHGVDTIAFLLYTFVVVTICILTMNSRNLKSVKTVSFTGWGLLAIVGICATLFNLGNFEGVRLAPNVGYVNAINVASNSVVTVLAVLLFKDELTLKKAIGVAGVIGGICLLLI